MLELDAINAYYGKSHILQDVSFNVRSNEIVALLGRNGAGKTTTCRSIMGVIPRLTGSITMNGEDISGQSPDKIYRHGITWIPERRRIFPNLTTIENLEMGLSNRNERQSRLEEVYDLFPRLEERTEQKGRTLSGGEQQMLAIGRALMSRPKLMIVDEPFEGLMPSLITDVAEALEQLAESNIAMLITDQKTDETLGLSDQAVIIENGSIEHSDSAAAITGNKQLQEQYLGV